MHLRARARELRQAAAFVRGLGEFLAGRPPEPAEAARQLRHRLAEREAAFAALLDRAVFARASGAWARLFAWADVAPADVERLLASDGLDATLGRLHDAGVRLSLDEFKGKRPLVRGGRELASDAADFDNPLPRRPFVATTGGSTGAARAVLVDLDLLAHESLHHALFLHAAGAGGRPVALWHLAPPGAVGLKVALVQARLGRPVERWFAQSRSRDAGWRHALFARAALRAARRAGARLPDPEAVDAREAIVVARWLAEQTGRGTPALLATTVSGAVRAAGAALDAGLDIAGTLFVLVGEPFTPAKAAILARAGARAFAHYAMTEAGLIGVACCGAAEPDAVHVAEDKVALLTRPRAEGGEALALTTLHPASPKLMINVETGDAAVVERRACDCGVLPGEFRARLHTLRSYEKLTSEGMHLVGADVLGLVEEHLPATFGGRPTDYQLVERERDGLAVVSLVVRPEVGELDERRVVASALAFLGARGAGQRLTAQVWGAGGTLRVLRAAPQATAGGKIPALRTLAE